MHKIVACLSDQPRVEVVSRSATYVHAIARTRWLRFVDDVEFFVDDHAKLIHFRSASRLGYSDMGVNRRRMERLSQSIATLL
jgi:uncharacterized protein (DUF1499 family)